MSLIRFLFLDRIGGQIAILILASLLAIHAIITASILLSHPGRWIPPDDDAALVALARVVAASPPAKRAPLLADFARAFPDMGIATAAGMPPEHDAESDVRLRFLQDRLGASFRLASLPQTSAVAVRLPDGEVLTGPMEPISEALPEPMRRMAKDNRNTGNTVEKIAMAMERSYTRNGSSSADSGRITPNCNRLAALATTIA